MNIIFIPPNLEDIKEEINQYKDAESFLRLMSDHFKYHSDEFRLINKAHKMVVEDFEGKFRHTGEEYVEHLRRTALICFCYREDKSSLSVIERLLHDWPEDINHATYHDLFVNFGAVVSHTVVGVTNPHVTRLDGMTDREYKRLKQFCKFGKVTQYGRRAMLLKCDDRFDNTLTLWGTPEEKLFKIIETMEWVVPISMKVENTLLAELIESCVKQLDRLHVNDTFNKFLL